VQSHRIRRAIAWGQQQIKSSGGKAPAAISGAEPPIQLAAPDRGGRGSRREGEGVFSLRDRLLVDLEDVYGHAGGGGELLVADVALEVLGLLVLDEDLLVVELAVAVVAEDLLHALLLLPHRRPPPPDAALPFPLRRRGPGLQG